MPVTRAPASQCTGTVLMVRPANFGFNAQTAASNRFQRTSGESAAGAAVAAVREFDGVVAALRGEGISVCVADDSAVPPKPDALFPNNWLSLHHDGTLVLYPMLADIRRLERRQEIIDLVCAQTGFHVARTLDLTAYETAERHLEGTGSLVLDHAARVAYACRSPRTDEGLVREWAAALQYEPIVFDALDAAGVPIYHTNVIMSIGVGYAAVGSATIAPHDRATVLAKLVSTGRELVELDHDEINGFAGNMLELGSWDENLGDCRLLVMSSTARQALRPGNYRRLAASTDNVLVVRIPTIEALGGGSVRCMLAEIFTT